MKDIVLEEILGIVERIEKILNGLKKTENEEFIDNQEFLQLMKITTRTAQKWRDTGIVGYSLVGGKVYYKKEEITTLLKKSYKKKRITTH